jgi:hypothetical protein
VPTVAVATPAVDRSLATLASVKAELGIPDADTASDAILHGWILTESDRLVAACGIVGDDLGDAPPTLAAETATVTFAASEVPCSGPLILPWRVPARVTGVSVGGTSLDAAGWRAEPRAGLLHRAAGAWARAEIVVTVASGYAPGKVPVPVADAVRELVRRRWHAKDRDPLLRSYASPDVEAMTYMDADRVEAEGGLPRSVMEALRAAGVACAAGVA